MQVRQWMSSPAIAASDRLSAPEALWMMDERKVRRLPVVDERERLIGIVTRSDLQSKLGPFPISWRRLKLGVTDAMSPDPLSVSPDDPIERAAQLMLARKISGLPVVDGGRVTGIITESDLFRAFCELLGVARKAA